MVRWTAPTVLMKRIAPPTQEFVHQGSLLASMECGGSIEGLISGKITSQNHSNDYENDLDCTWNIVVPHNQVYIQLRGYSIEYSPDCSKDYLVIINGETEEELAMLCGQGTLALSIGSSFVKIRFVTDASITSSGWTLYFTKEAFHVTSSTLSPTSVETTGRSSNTTTAERQTSSTLNTFLHQQTEETTQVAKINPVTDTVELNNTLLPNNSTVENVVLTNQSLSTLGSLSDMLTLSPDNTNSSMPTISPAGSTSGMPESSPASTTTDIPITTPVANTASDMSTISSAGNTSDMSTISSAGITSDMPTISPAANTSSNTPTITPAGITSDTPTILPASTTSDMPTISPAGTMPTVSPVRTTSDMPTISLASTTLGMPTISSADTTSDMSTILPTSNTSEMPASSPASTTSDRPSISPASTTSDMPTISPAGNTSDIPTISVAATSSGNLTLTLTNVTETISAILPTSSFPDMAPSTNFTPVNDTSDELSSVVTSVLASSVSTVTNSPETFQTSSNPLSPDTSTMQTYTRVPSTTHAVSTPSKFRHTIIIGKLFYAQVFDGDSKQRLAHVCGSAADNLLSNSSTVIIVFSTDSLIQKAGFTMHWQSINANECGGNIFNTSGVLTSPNYPGLYPHSLDCQWNITVPNGTI
ncbi:cubn [Bugula neritina]|uniref:Cubn n=1 Tax=Bugula neritina TaxID=10212 RepID=A0A7J7KGG1_BUGNE|nr:cubn [Bugula neritina]